MTISVLRTSRWPSEKVGVMSPTFWRAHCAGGGRRSTPSRGHQCPPDRLWICPPKCQGAQRAGGWQKEAPPGQGHQASSVYHRDSTRDAPVPIPQGWGSPWHPSETLLGDLAPPSRAPAPLSRWGCTPAMLCHPCHAVSPPHVPTPCPRAVPAAGPTRSALLCSLPLPQASSFQTLLRQQARLEVLARRVTLLEAIIWPGNRTPPHPA